MLMSSCLLPCKCWVYCTQTLQSENPLCWSKFVMATILCKYTSRVTILFFPDISPFMVVCVCQGKFIKSPPKTPGYITGIYIHTLFFPPFWLSLCWDIIMETHFCHFGKYYEKISEKCFLAVLSLNYNIKTSKLWGKKSKF